MREEIDAKLLFCKACVEAMLLRRDPNPTVQFGRDCEREERAVHAEGLPLIHFPSPGFPHPLMMCLAVGGRPAACTAPRRGQLSPFGLSPSLRELFQGRSDQAGKRILSLYPDGWLGVRSSQKGAAALEGRKARSQEKHGFFIPGRLLVL